MMMKRRPYSGMNRQEIKEKMVNEFVLIKNEEMPEGCWFHQVHKLLLIHHQQSIKKQFFI